MRITPIAAACAVLLTMAGGASAQQADDVIPTVVVSGIRASIESAIAVKRNADSIVEAITAEDIGKLPDVSIGESIARMPGLTAQRVEGRAQVISIRGLAPDFAATLMNGRELVSTGENRSAEFDQYPSELINGVTVYKTPDATLMGQGLSGTIDLKTVRPLDLRGRTIALNGRIEKNSNGALNSNTPGRGQRLSISYVDQFLDNTVGLALGYAHLDSPSQQREYKSWWWGDSNNLPTGNKDVIGLKGAEVTATSSEQVRDGLMAVLEYRPTRAFRSSVDLYYSEFDQKRTMRGMMWSSNQWDNVGYANPVVETIDGTRMLTGGTVTGLRPVVRNDFNTRQDQLYALGWNNRLRLSEWALEGDLSHSKAEREERILETYAGLSTGGAIKDNFKFQIPTGAGLPTFTTGFNYADPNVIKLLDPAGWGRDALLNRPSVKDELSSLKLSGARSLDGIFSRIEAGANYSKREKTRTGIENDYNLKNGRAPVTVSPDLIQPSTSLGFAGIPAVLSYDVLGVLAKYYDQVPDRNNNIWKRDYTISEEISTAYAKLGIQSGLGAVPVSGNLGLQVIYTDQSSLGFNNVNGKTGALVRGTSYTDVLPSLNLNFDLDAMSKNAYLRFGAAKALARPRMDSLKAGASAGVDMTKRLWSGEGGNPELQPWRANAFDLSAEKYFGKRSYLAAALFYKKLESYIYNKKQEFDFTGFPNLSQVTPVSPIGTLNTPANGEGGMVRGVELSASLEAGMLWDALDGFGILGSASNTESSIAPNGPGTRQKLPGLSGVVSNVTLFYEKDGVSARVSRRYRSAFRGEVTGLFTDRSFSEILAEKQVDIQLGYAIETGQYKGLSFLLQVNNLNNAPYQTRQGDGFSNGAYAPERYTTFGRQVLLGVNYKL
ncbi:TonB-dependent receptor [Massilia cavernae]|nr:TonB-dependent receptor [Massilia cavernae]